MKDPLQNRQCQGCIYFVEMTESRKKLGTCHRYAPSPGIPEKSSYRTQSWPIVEADSFCGEYQDKL